MPNLLRVLSLLMLLSLSSWTKADMFVDRSIVVFEPGAAPRQDLKVSNTDPEDVYVQIEVLKVENPGSDNETRTVIKDPKALKLLATPNKLVIPPNGQKLVRIVNLEQNNQEERIYRINVTPIVAPLEEEESQLRIVVAYQVLAIIQPDNPKSDLTINREGSKLTLSNTGNTNILLSDGKQCNPLEKNICEDLTSHRLYAGNMWELELPFDGPLSYSLRSFDGIKTELIP